MAHPLLKFYGKIPGRLLDAGDDKIPAVIKFLAIAGMPCRRNKQRDAGDISSGFSRRARVYQGIAVKISFSHLMPFRKKVR
jgi:hypothetical protein